VENDLVGALASLGGHGLANDVFVDHVARTFSLIVELLLMHLLELHNLGSYTQAELAEQPMAPDP
jgi:hypothetical protein